MRPSGHSEFDMSALHYNFTSGCSLALFYSQLGRHFRIITFSNFLSRMLSFFHFNVPFPSEELIVISFYFVSVPPYLTATCPFVLASSRQKIVLHDVLSRNSYAASFKRRRRKSFLLRHPAIDFGSLHILLHRFISKRVNNNTKPSKTCALNAVSIYF